MIRDTLSLRLNMVASLVIPGQKLIDVGTDHAWLPIALVQEGTVPSAVAADVTEGPLQTAREHIVRQHLSDRIETRLSDGLNAFEPEEVTQAVFAGMGGCLIADLLNRAFCQGKLRCCRTLILSPQSDAALVRRTIHAVGFQIDQEKMCEDRGKYYLAIRAVPGRESYSAEDYIFGRKLSENHDPVFAIWLDREKEKKKHIVQELQTVRPSSASGEARLAQLVQELALIAALQTGQAEQAERK